MIPNLVEQDLISSEALMQTEAKIFVDFFEKYKTWIQELKNGNIFELEDKTITYWEDLGLLMWRDNEFQQLKYFYELEIYQKIYLNSNNQTNPASESWKLNAEPILNDLKLLKQKISKSEKTILKYSISQNYGSMIVALEGQTYSLPVQDKNIQVQKCWNPFVYMLDNKELATWLVAEFQNKDQQRMFNFEVKDCDEIFLKLLDELLSNRKLNRKEMLELYVSKLKQGEASLGGGHTTDSRWSVYFENNAFWSSSYVYRGDYPEKVVEPVTEEKVREMILFYNFTGLQKTKES